MERPGSGPGAAQGAAGLRVRAPRPAELQVMDLVLHVWRQANAQDAGRFTRYDVHDVSPDMSFLELLDVLNEMLTARHEEPIAFDHDCREGICGSCGVVI